MGPETECVQAQAPWEAVPCRTGGLIALDIDSRVTLEVRKAQL